MNLDELIESYRQDIIRHTVELIKIKSVQDTPRPGMPFGQGINRALEYVLDLGEQMGFNAVNLNGYAGYIEYGQGKQMIAMLTHLDVVPEGEGWTFDPYGGEIHQNRIYGRGAIDDKSAAISCIFALKALAESGGQLTKRVRIIFGTNEENDWQGIKYYLKNQEMPLYAIVPDAAFPVINAEKGILSVQLYSNQPLDTHEKFITNMTIKGGTRDNMVPDFCICEFIPGNGFSFEHISNRLYNFINDTGYDMQIKKQGNKICIISHGISAHASTPEKGKNAIMQLIMFIYQLNNCINDKFVSFIAEKIGMHVNGENLALNLSDGISGSLTLNPAVIDIKGNYKRLIVNIRFPVTYSKDEIITRLKDSVRNYAIDMKIVNYIKPHYVDENSALVKTLLDVYNSYMNTKLSALSTGGGTYARAFENAVAFGPTFPGVKELAHQKDEYVDIDELITSCKIYSKALQQLCKK